jgi:hypothetical protein
VEYVYLAAVRAFIVPQLKIPRVWGGVVVAAIWWFLEFNSVDSGFDKIRYPVALARLSWYER